MVSSDCSGRPAAQSGRVSISRRRIAFASSARASSTSQTISSCVVMRIGMNASAGLVSIRVTVCAQEVGGGGLDRVLAERAVP